MWRVAITSLSHTSQYLLPSADRLRGRLVLLGFEDEVVQRCALPDEAWLRHSAIGIQLGRFGDKVLPGRSKLEIRKVHNGGVGLTPLDSRGLVWCRFTLSKILSQKFFYLSSMKTTSTFTPKDKVNRPGIHAKTKTSKNKKSKLYKKAYRGQGR